MLFARTKNGIKTKGYTLFKSRVKCIENHFTNSLPDKELYIDLFNVEEYYFQHGWF